jgi:transglutaminase-like putative cysteine protease
MKMKLIHSKEEQKAGMRLDRYLKETRLLDYRHPTLVKLVEERRWGALEQYENIASIYSFVQNEIVFGHNKSDDIPASEVLQDGYGQCNTKSTLLMALLRRCGVPCRFHGFTIDKRLQEGAVTGLAYSLHPGTSSTVGRKYTMTDDGLTWKVLFLTILIWRVSKRSSRTSRELSADTE